MDRDISQALQQSIAEAAGRSRPLQIIGGNSKAFYGREVDAEPLQVAAHRGIRNYAPTELVVTARAGTPLAELEQTLAAQGQMLPGWQWCPLSRRPQRHRQQLAPSVWWRKPHP